MCSHLRTPWRLGDTGKKVPVEEVQRTLTTRQDMAMDATIKCQRNTGNC